MHSANLLTFHFHLTQEHKKVRSNTTSPSFLGKKTFFLQIHTVKLVKYKYVYMLILYNQEPHEVHYSNPIYSTVVRTSKLALHQCTIKLKHVPYKTWQITRVIQLQKEEERKFQQFQQIPGPGENNCYSKMWFFLVCFLFAKHRITFHFVCWVFKHSKRNTSLDDISMLT